MKRFLSVLALVAGLAVSAYAQTPEVVITVDEVTNTSYTCSFVPNASCSEYYIIAGQTGELDGWIPMMGSLEAIITSWGVSYQAADSFTWDEQTPGQEYVVYALAIGETSVIYTDTLTTLTSGGSGASIITVSVSNIGDTCATTTAIPNDQTALFKDRIITREYLEQVGTDSVISMLQTDVYTYYETDTWTWLSLTAGTEYYFVAIGQNADGVWGELASVAFATTGGTGVAEMSTPAFSIYPNPAVEQVRVSGLPVGGTLVLYDAQGRVVRSEQILESEMMLSLTGLQSGTYFVMAQSGKGSVPATSKLIVR